MNEPPSVLALVAAGVFDFRLPHSSFPGFANERDVGPGATGIQSMIGLYMVDRFDAALSCLVVSEKQVFEKQTVDLRYVLAQPWRLDRLENSRRRREDSPAQPIDVNRVSFPRPPRRLSGRGWVSSQFRGPGQW